MADISVKVTNPNPISLKVNSPSTPRIETTYLNPKAFRVQDATDVALNNPSDGQILTWSATLNKFIVSSAGNVSSAFALANNASVTANLAILIANNASGIAANAGNVFHTTYVTSGLTVNTATTYTTYGNATVILSANAGSLTQPGALQLNDTLTSTSTSLAASANAANALNTYAKSLQPLIQSAYDQANTDEVLAQAAFNSTNATNMFASSGYGIANSALNLAISVYTQANTDNVLAQAAFGQANAVNTYAISGYTTANSALNLATNAYGRANSSFNQANNALNLAISAFLQANTDNVLAQAAFNSTNATNTYATSGYGVANIALNLAISAFSQANTDNVLAQAAFTTANAVNTFAGSGYGIANSALNLAQSAYGRANAGGIGGGTQTILTSNGITVNAGTLLTVSGNNTVTLSANIGNTTQAGIVQLNDTVKSTSVLLGATANAVNTVWATANAAYIATNATNTYATSGYGIANSALNLASSAFNQANTDNVLAQAAFNTANATNTYASSGYAIANSALNLSQSAFNRANSGGVGGGSQTIVTSNGITVNTGTSITVSGNNTISLSVNVGNTNQAGIVQLNDTINSGSTTQAATANAVSTVWNTAFAAFAKANTGGGGGAAINQTVLTANGLTVNNGTSLSVFGNNTIILSANIGNTTQSGIVQLNDTINSGSTTLAATANAVNTVWATANAAFNSTNATNTYAGSGYGIANSALNLSQSAYALTNSTTNLIGSVYPVVNGHTNLITSAFTRANAAIQNQLTLVSSNGITTNSATTLTVTGNATVFISANTGNTTKAGIVQLNDTVLSTSSALAATANAVNTVWSQAQSAFIYANSVFNNANTNRFSRNSIATYWDVNGNLAIAANNVIRIDTNPTTLNSNGALIEVASSNLIRNPRMEGNTVFTGTVAKLVATIAGGNVSNVIIVDAGSGYVTPPLISFFGGGFTIAAVATAAIANGSIANVTISNSGAGYSTIPTVLAFSGLNPTNWSGRYTPVNAGVENGLPFIDYQFRGSGAGYTDLTLDTTSPAFAGGNGNSAIMSVYFRVVSGSLANLASFGLTLYGLPSFSDNGGIGLLTANANTSILRTQRIVGVPHVFNNTTANLSPRITITGNGGDFDITFRIGGPQLEAGNVATSLILPPSGSQQISFRAADVTNGLGYNQIVVGGVDVGSSIVNMYNAVNATSNLVNSTTNLITNAYNTVNSTTNLVTSAYNVVNSTTNLVTSAFNLANSSNNLVAGAYALANTAVQRAGDTITGGLIINGSTQIGPIGTANGNAVLNLNAPSGSNTKLIQFKSSGNTRWQFGLGDLPVGNNSGDNISFNSLNDDGSYKGRILGLNRATWVSSFGGQIQIPSMYLVSAVNVANVTGITSNPFFSYVPNVYGNTANGISYNTFTVQNDNANTGGSNALTVSYNFGGNNFLGGAQALNIGFSMSGDIPPEAGKHYYTGVDIYTPFTHWAGGTGASYGQSQGALYGLNITPSLTANANNFSELVGAEIDNTVAPGLGISQRVNLKLILLGNHGSMGQDLDAMLQFGRGSAAIGARNIFQLGSINDSFPLDANGSILGIGYKSAAAPNNPFVANAGFNLNGIKFINHSFASPGYKVDTYGSVIVGSNKISASNNGLVIDSSGFVGLSPTIFYAGTGFANNSIITTGLGDLYSVTVDGSSRLQTLTVLVPAYASSIPNNPLNVQGDQNQSLPAQINLTWVAANTLTLNPSGNVFVNNGFSVAGVDIGSGLQGSYNTANNALNLAQSAFNKANTGGGGGAAIDQTIITANGLTVNTGTLLHVIGNNTIVLSANIGNTTQPGMVQLVDTINSTSVTLGATANSVNTVWATTNATSIRANAINTYAISGYGVANSALNLSQSAYALTNSTTNLVGSVFALSNSQTNLISSSYAQGNSTTNLVTGAYALANSDADLVASAFTVANAAVIRSGDTMTGGLTINTTNVGLNVNTISMGIGTGGKLNLFGTTYGVGINSNELTMFMPASAFFGLRTGLINSPWLLRVGSMTSPGLPSGLYYTGNASSNLSGGLDRTAIGLVSPNTGIFTNLLSTNSISIAANVYTSNVFANTSLTINNIDIGSGLASVWTLANSTTNLVTSSYSLANTTATSLTSTTNLVTSAYALTNSTTNLVASAYARANIAETNQIIFNTTNGIAANGGSTATVIGNNSIALTANNASTTAVGVVQLNDTFTSTSVTQPATANVANTIWTSLKATSTLVNSTTNLVTGAYALANSDANLIASAYGLANTTSTSLTSTTNLVTSAYARANAVVQNQHTFTATNGLAANAGSTATVTGNNTVALTANNASTTAVGVVQLNDTFTSTSTTQAATANVANTIWTTTQAAFAKANMNYSWGNTFISANLTVTGGTSLVINSNTIMVLSANLGNTTQLGVVQLNDTVTSTSTTLVATANVANTIWTTTQAAFAKANGAVMDAGDYMTGTLTVPSLTANNGINTSTIVANSNVSGANFVTTGSVNSQSIMVSPVGNLTLSMANSGQVLVVNSSSLTTITVGTAVGSVGFRCMVTQIGTGNVQFTASGTTLNNRLGANNRILGQYGSMSLFCYQTNAFIVSGEIN